MVFRILEARQKEIVPLTGGKTARETYTVYIFEKLCYLFRGAADINLVTAANIGGGFTSEEENI